MYLELAENGETVTGAQQYIPVETNQGILQVRADIVPQITGTTPTTIDPGGIWYTTGEADLYELPNLGSNKINKFNKLTQLEFEPGTFGTAPNIFKRTIAAPGTNLYGFVLKNKLTQKEPIIVPTASSVTIQGETPTTTTTTNNVVIDKKPSIDKKPINKLLILSGLSLIALYFVFRKK